ncbi:hypothetical protein D3C72_1890710 [compost metagenome]
MLSITRVLPVVLENCEDSGRANASVPPPAGKGTTQVTGLLGQSLADSAMAHSGRPPVAMPAAIWPRKCRRGKGWKEIPGLRLLMFVSLLFFAAAGGTCSGSLLQPVSCTTKPARQTDGPASMLLLHCRTAANCNQSLIDESCRRPSLLVLKIFSIENPIKTGATSYCFRRPGQALA